MAIGDPLQPGLDSSNDFGMKVNGADAWVERFHSVHMACPRFSGPGEIRVTCREPIRSWNVKPASAAVPATLHNNELVLKLDRPRKLWIEINAFDPLLLLADAPDAAPQAGAPDVLFFGPGKHCPGIIALKDNQTLYLAEGAIA